MSSNEAKSVFFELLDLPPAERPAYIKQACGHDAGLLARVEALLSAHTGAGGFLGETAEEGLSGNPGGPASSEEPDAPDTIGPYRVVGTLGHGGFGTVYLCEQTEPIQRKIAVKVIRQGMDTRSILRRFEEERVLLSKMNHPGIARVLDAGRSGQGLPFIAMEYIEGERITEYCDRQRLDLHARLRLFAQACTAVQHAHQKGVIHRDIKPSNVLVTEIDEKPVVKVIDFGVSKALDDHGEDDSITRTMQLVGTPQYMSPEQASTVETDLDTRTDVYSLGVMLYELSAGSPPFDPETLRSASVGQLERMIRELDPVLPSVRVERLDAKQAEAVALTRSTPRAGIVRQLRGEIDWVIARAMEKSRDRRYPSAFAFCEDVLRVVGGEMVLARPPSRAYAIRKLVARNRAKTLAAALAVITLVSVTGVSLLYASKIHRANTRIQQTLNTQERVLGFTEQMLRGIDPAVARGKDTELFRLVLDRASARIGSELQGTPEVEVRVRMLVGELYSSIGEFEPAMEQMRGAAGTAQESLGAHDPLTLAARSALGAAHIELSSYTEARVILEDAYEQAVAGMGQAHPDTLVVLGNLVAVYNYLGDHEASARAAGSLLEARVQAIGDQHEDTMAARNALALALRGLGQHEPAKELFERVLEYQLEAMGEDHPNTLKTRTNLAQSYQQLGMIEQSAAMSEKILEQKTRVLGGRHPSVIVSMANLAMTLQAAGDRERALSLLSRAHEISLETLGPGHQYTLIIRNNLGNYHAKNKEFEEALPWLRLACSGLDEQLGETHPMTITGRGSLIDVLIELGQFTEALELSVEQSMIANERFGSADQRLGMINERVGVCLLNLKRQAEAQPYFSSAARIYLQHHGAESEQYQRLTGLMRGGLDGGAVIRGEDG